jgi:uncharacterized metal-binding protein YceD (DUF177 family)
LEEKFHLLVAFTRLVTVHDRNIDTYYFIDKPRKIKRVTIGRLTRYDFFASLEKSEILSGTVDGKVTLNLREEDYQLNIAVQGTVFVVCDRCLDPMPLEIVDEQEIFSEDEETGDDDEIVNRQSSNRQSLDLSWLVYEIVSINIPIVHSHQPGECNQQMELLLQSHLCAEPDPDVDTEINN